MNTVFLKKIIYHPFTIDFFQKLFPVSGAILMFHRVRNLRKDSIQYNDHLSVSPEFFDHLLAQAEKARYSFISLDELVDLLEKKKKFSKVLALTFDDGYMDNLINALPVMEQYNAPATIFCATGLMTGEAGLWWDILEEYILSHDTVETVSGMRMIANTKEEKEKIFLFVRQELLFLQEKEQENYFVRLGYLPEELKRRSRQEMIPVKMLASYRESRLVSFGSHTHSHSACGKFSSERFAGELTHSLQLLRSTGADVRHFAYPYGDDVKDLGKFREIFLQHGIRSCSTTFSGFVSCDTSPLFLPRFFVSEYADFTVKKNFFEVQVQILKKKVRGKQ